ncbi:MAG: hypothetical protein IJH53_09590 [Oscillospiraceae bacterium]|nr:hypothetical protein [Oscillospiraceae bacterium]
MQDKRYGEFDSFDDFLSNLKNDLAESHASDDALLSAQENENTNENAVFESESDQHNSRADGPIRDTRRKSSKIKKQNEETTEKKRHGYRPFFLALAVITVIAWILPLRPTVSISEKRTLDEFPKFSVGGLASGDYFRAIEDWFSDTFTLRENWIGLANRIESVYGIRTVAIYGDIPVADAIPVPSKEPSEVSLDLPEDPVITDPVEEIDSPVIDDEPIIEDDEQWGGLIIDEDDLIEDRGAKVFIGDHFFVYPEFNLEYANLYAKVINKIASTLSGKADFYCIIAPHSVSSMLTREDREKYGFVIEEDAFDYIYGLMNSDVKTVNVLPNLQKHNNEYIVFKSDPHWTALGAYYAYEAWCDVAGKTPVPLSEYKEYAWEDFFGTYYYTGGTPKSIKDNPDIVYAYEPPGDVHLFMDYTNGLKLGTETDLLLDRSTRKVDQYITFLGTDKAKATFINNDIDDDSAVLVLKTSFGNPFVYYLTQHYHCVYVVDLRYYNYSVTRFMEYNKVDDVIVIHASDLCYSSASYSTVSKLLK